MSKTAVADIIIPTEFEKYAIERTAELAQFGQCGIVEAAPEFDRIAAEAGGQTMIEQEATDALTLGAVLDRIGGTWPLLERRLRDERGQLRRYINVYVDGEECRHLDGLSTPVSDRAEILVVPSVAGG